MTTTGENRDFYAKNIEARPSRFDNPAEYYAWAERADRAAAKAESQVREFAEWAGMGDEHYLVQIASSGQTTWFEAWRQMRRVLDNAVRAVTN